MSLEEIRARNKNGKLDRFLKAAGKTAMGKQRENNDQEATFYPERDKAGDGSAIIRFLPGLESEDYPYYVERFQHGFQHNKKWYIEFCPSTPGIDRECPVCNYGFDIMSEYGGWKDCPKDVQNDLRPRFRTQGFRAGYYCNVLVIKDPVHPENEGKVHLFKFGKAIMNFIMDKVYPKDDGLGTTPDGVDIFDLDEGMNFKFIIHQKDGRADYLSSVWEPASKCPEFDIESQQALFPLVDESLFKSDEELTARFNTVFNKKKTYIPNAEEAVGDGTDNNKKEGAKLPEVSEKKEDTPLDTGKADDTSKDDNMAYFQDLAEEVNI